MTLEVFVPFNGFLNCSGQPKFDDHAPEVFAKSFERFLLTGDEARVFEFENCFWYHIGTYDDESMKFVPLKEPLKIVDCNRVLDERKIKAKLIEAARKKEDESHA